MNYDTDWRARVKQWKRDKGLKDADLAAEMDIARGTLNSWLNEREPNVRDLLRLIEVMRADPIYILFGHSLDAPPKIATPAPNAYRVRQFKQNKLRHRRTFAKT